MPAVSLQRLSVWVAVGVAFNFFLTTDTPERLPFIALTEIRMGRAPNTVHRSATDRTGKPTLCVEVFASIKELIKAV